MAVRDRNLFAWQAYVITMSIVSVLLLGGMFFLWRAYSDLSTRFDDQKTALDNASSQFRDSDGRVQRLMAMMGYGNYTKQELEAQAQQYAADEVLAPVETEFADLMKLFTAGDRERNLMKLPEFLMETIRLRNAEIARKDATLKRQEDRVEAKITAENQARLAAEAGQKKAEQDLATTRQEHTAAIAKLNKEKEDAYQRFDQYKTSMDQQLANVKSDLQKEQIKTSEQAETIKVQMDIINQFRNPDFAAPQGEIVRVRSGGTEVWINLGQADGLRTGVPFSIIDESAVNISEAEPKAQLVVTHVVDSHLCRAKVTEYDFRKPIVTGDKVYSPAWRPGRKVGFALVGMMDINGDRSNDADQVRELIRVAGGVVDEEIDTKGNRNGAGMTPNTSFLVLGTDLTLPENASPELRAEQAAKAKLYADFIAEARQKGIIQISLDKLIGYLKTEGSDRTVPLGNRIRGQDFPIRAPNTPPVSRTPTFYNDK